MSAGTGFFIDWDGNVRASTDPGGGYLCDVDAAARYVGVKTKTGILVHEATFYKNLAAIERAGLKGTLVPGSRPWGAQGQRQALVVMQRHIAKVHRALEGDGADPPPLRHPAPGNAGRGRPR
ncbi:MAG: hypothetical protein Q7K57_12905 [Burkholderiaceae bacterium]|nr:hypothetical protein [Burkholderiaceae bacterium]